MRWLLLRGLVREIRHHPWAGHDLPLDAPEWVKHSGEEVAA